MNLTRSWRGDDEKWYGCREQRFAVLRRSARGRSRQERRSVENQQRVSALLTWTSPFVMLNKAKHPMGGTRLQGSCDAYGSRHSPEGHTPYRSYCECLAPASGIWPENHVEMLLLPPRPLLEDDATWGDMPKTAQPIPKYTKSCRLPFDISNS